MLRQLSAAVFRSRPKLPTPFYQTTRSMFIQTQSTPNAHAVMFLPGREVMPGGRGTADFPTIRSTTQSPLAASLFAVSGVRSVFFGSDFITITKDDPIDWAVLRPEIFETVMDFFTTDSPQVILHDGDAVAHPDTLVNDHDTEVVAMIKELLETRVKPAVAEDGGSILYRGFDEQNGIVKLELQGACSTCSSSSITLKNGVENMLRHYIPEVKSVEEILGEHIDNLQKANLEALNEVERKLQEKGVLRS